FEVELPLQVLFESATIAGLADRIGEARGSKKVEGPPLERVPREGTLSLSFAQQRLWFLDQLEPGSSLYNIPSALRLRGALDEAALQQSLSEIVRRHEVLRTTFSLHEDQPIQVIGDAAEVVLSVEDRQGLPAEDRGAAARRAMAEEAQRPFDLQRGPLFRASLLRLAEEDHILLLSMHHIVSDGWSMGVLIGEL